uniref:Uncharacterized protein n=1 Tax=Rhizophora mucronata TaxID=61149 RepID=A0A2P2QIH8_RHIMU
MYLSCNISSKLAFCFIYLAFWKIKFSFLIENFDTQLEV